MRNALLAVRAAFFVVIFPGMVAGYIPYRLARVDGRLPTLDFSLQTILAAVVVLAGVAVLLRCVWDFFAAGGTLAPVDPPKHLVVRGLYRFTRNPMYNGVLAAILGQAWLFRSVLLVEYALLVLLVFHVFVALHEEPALTSSFGENYRAYRRAVPRWGFKIRPYVTGSDDSQP